METVIRTVFQRECIHGVLYDFAIIDFFLSTITNCKCFSFPKGSLGSENYFPCANLPTTSLEMRFIDLKGE
jgi:hypothetical protein